MNWLLLTALAILSRSFQSITTKVMSNRAKVSSITQSVLFLGTAFILSLLISPFVGGISFEGISNVWITTVIMVMSLTVGNILFFRGLSKLEASITAIAFSSILLWGAILSVIILGSSFSPTQMIGIALLGCAILLVQKNSKSYKVDPSILYIILSALLFAIFQVSSAELAKTMPAGTYLFLSFGGATLVTYLFNINKIKQDYKYLVAHKVSIAKATVLAAVCSTGYFIFSYFAYRYAPDRGVVVVLLTSQVILSVLLGILLLNEKDRLPLKMVSGLLALIAGILIKS
ncbi:MAG: EamA protein [Patescibacteria group bacterium]|jgi:drug/metabolite transporter (DMT)-like permease|nr:EamA protein [Patescibacteria group bacterium]